MSTVYQSSFRKLIAWKEAHKLTLMVYRSTGQFPKSELYAMTSQLRRASSSIEAQLAEGSRMETSVHRKVYYSRSYASSAEVDCFLELAKDLGYINHEAYEKLNNQVNRVSYLINKLHKSCTTPSQPAKPPLPAKPN